MKRPHECILTNRILKKVFTDESMHIYTKLNDPFKEFINYTLAHEDEELQYDLINHVSYSFNPQTCDLNEPCFIYKIKYDSNIYKQPINLTGVTYIAYNTPINIPITTVDDVYSLMDKHPTRVSFTGTYNIDNIFPSEVNPTGIIWTHDLNNRYGQYYIITDSDPLNSGFIYVLDNDFNVIMQSGTGITKYASEFYYCDDELWTWDSTTHYSGTYVIPYHIDINSFKFYDMVHLDHSGYPILIDQSEYAIEYSGGNTILYLSECINGRSTYNPDYYSSPMQSGQPDKYWNGKYAMKFIYSPFTTYSNGLATYGYFYELPYDTTLVPNIPKSLTTEIPYDYAKSDSEHDITLSISPKFIRPGQSVNIKLYFTRRIIETWNLNTTFSGTISDPDFYETNIDSVKLYINNTQMDDQLDITINGNTIIVETNDELKSKYGLIDASLYIYYKVYFDYDVITMPSYSGTSINYIDDYTYDKNGYIVPHSIVEIDKEGLDSEFANISLKIYATYDFAGIAFDPYRKIFWTYEKNNAYLSARSTDTLSVLQNIPIFRNPNITYVYLDDVKKYVIDLSEFNKLDVISIKYQDGYLYLLCSDQNIYTIDMFYDKQEIDIEYISYPEHMFEPLYIGDNINNTGTPIDFTFTKENNIAILYDNKTIDIYKTWYDYAIVDELDETIAFREKYDIILPFSGIAIGQNRITDLDNRAIEYFNELRYPGETLHEFYDRLKKYYLPLWDENIGVNSSQQGIYNYLSMSFDYDPQLAPTNRVRHIYLKYVPVEHNNITGEDYSVRVLLTDTDDNTIEYTRIGMHRESKYDQNLTSFLYDNTYKIDNLYDAIPDNSFIIWRNYDGTLTNHIELKIPENTKKIQILYYIYTNWELYRPINEEYNINNNIEYSESEIFSVYPIDQSFLSNSGMEYDRTLVEEYLKNSKRHWGYGRMDETITADKNYEQRNVLICYNNININNIIIGG